MRRRYTKQQRNNAFIMGVAIGSLLMAIAFMLRGAL